MFQYVCEYVKRAFKSAKRKRENSINSFISLIEQYAPVKKLDGVLLNNLIEKIVVHERQRIDGETIMPIEIYDRFIGNVSETQQDMLLTGRFGRTKDF